MHSYFKLVSIFISLAVLTGCDRSDTAAALVEVMAELESYDEAGLDTEEFEYMRSASATRANTKRRAASWRCSTTS